MTGPAPITADEVLSWGRHTGGSPLYTHLVQVTAASSDLMAVIQRINHVPPPNLYFAAIHYLLIGGVSDRLADFYPSMVARPRPINEIDAVFTDFVQAHQDQIVGLANSRYTQTNECRRCVALLPAVMTSPFPRFHLVEIGTSAGLNLAMDQYQYNYEGIKWGPSSPVHLVADIRGDPPKFRDIELASRTGIDLNLIDRREPEDRRWLEALIWPEQHQRRERLQSALQVSAGVEMDLLEGDLLDELDTCLARLSGSEPAIVVDSFVLNQLNDEQRKTVANIVESERANRPIYRVSLDLFDIKDESARLQVGSEIDLVDLGLAHHHGEWVELSYDSLT